MTKDTLIFLCSPDINRLVARRCLGSIKATDLSRAELHIFDNNYDHSFSHPILMERMLRMAEKRGMNLLFLDDDVEISRFNWIDRLYEVSEDMGADIISCVHTNDSGDINHVGEFIRPNGTSLSIFDMRHEPDSIVNGAVYAPVLCSALMLVKNPGRYYMDLGYKKYKQDLDICMQAWDIGERVALALDMQVIHNRGFTGDQDKAYGQVFTNDASYFAKRWRDKLDLILRKPELIQYKGIESIQGWGHWYANATDNIGVDKEESIRIFREIAEACYIPRLVAGAYYYIYKLTGNADAIRECNRINPCHMAAQKLLMEEGGVLTRCCEYTYDCRSCALRANSHVTNQIRDILYTAFRGR